MTSVVYSNYAIVVNILCSTPPSPTNPKVLNFLLKFTIKNFLEEVEQKNSKKIADLLLQ